MGEKTSAEEYRQWAKQCRSMVSNTSEPKERLRWAELADEMEAVAANAATERDPRVTVMPTGQSGEGD